MPADRLTGSDKRTLLLWIGLGILGILFAQRFFFRAFPEASVEFKITRSDAMTRAKAFAESMGENVSGYESTIVFQVSETSKTYLERELGLSEANRLMSGDLNLWFWEVRFFRPQQEEELHVRVSPAGKIVGYERTLPEAAPGVTLTREAALESAQKFLESRLGPATSGWEYLPEEANSEQRPNRTDWAFTWERKNFKAKDAPYRLTVGLQGDQVSSLDEFLQVPEAWKRDYRKLRSTNELYGQIALVPYGFLLGGAIWLGVTLTRQGKTVWGPALKIGAVVAVLFALMEFNQWDAIKAGYDTHASYSSFLLEAVLKTLAAALFTGLTVTLVIPGGEPLYRAAQPQHLRLYEICRLRAIRSKEFFVSAIIGLSMAAAHIGFIVAFYLIGSKIGVWAPQDLNYSDAVNTALPWIAGVAVGVMAATSEEFLFRLFAIPFLGRLMGSRVLAILLPAFFWSFLHSNYPQEPGYVRGIEVGLIGIVAGLVMSRWGIIATLTWHYTVDASLVGMLLIRSDSLYLRISGIVAGLAVLIPVAISGISYLRRGTFEDVEDLRNAAAPTPEIDLAQAPPAEEAPAKRGYDALTAGALGVLAVALIVGGILAATVKRPAIGDYLKLTTDARMATTLANRVLGAHNVDPRSYIKATQFADATDPITNEYLRRRLSIAQINEIYATRVPGGLWRVRYFRDLQPEEYAVILRPDGSLHSLRHTLPEAAPGANLTKDDALTIAEKFLREEKHIDLSGWKLVDSGSEKRPKRTDHVFTWQQNEPLDPANDAKDSTDQAYARMELHILGDEPTSYRTFIKIPDGFVRSQETESLPRTLMTVWKILFGLGFVVAALILFFSRMKSDPSLRVPWRRVLGWSTVGLLAFLLNFLLGQGIPQLLMRYNSSISIRVFFATMSVGTFLIAAFVFGSLILVFGFAWNYIARAFGVERTPSWFGMPGTYYRDAALIGLGGALFWIGFGRALGAVLAHWPTWHRAIAAQFGGSFDAVLPAAQIIGSSIVRGLYLTGFLGLLAGLFGSEIRNRGLRLLVYLGIVVALLPDWGSPGDFAKQLFFNVVLLAVAVVGLRYFVRLNMLGCFLIFAISGCLGGAAELLAQPDAFYRAEGYMVVAAIAILVLWPVVVWKVSPQLPEGAPRAPQA